MTERIFYLPTLGLVGTDNSFTENIQEDTEISYCFSTVWPARLDLFLIFPNGVWARN